MGVIRFFQGQNLSAKEGETVHIESSVYPMGENNYLDITYKVNAINATGGTATFLFAALTSIDGQSWVGVTDLDGNTTTTGETHKVGPVRGVYVQITCLLNLAGGAPEDYGFVTFEVTGNVLRSSA